MTIMMTMMLRIMTLVSVDHDDGEDYDDGDHDDEDDEDYDDGDHDDIYIMMKCLFVCL